MKHYCLIALLAIGCFLAAGFGLSSFLTTGLMRQYGLTKDSEILILGHSHIMLALNAAKMEEELGVKVSKYTREGVTVAERQIMAEHYLRLHSNPALKYVIYGVDPYLFTAEGLSANSYINFLPFMDDPGISKYIKGNIGKYKFLKYSLLPLCRFTDATINAGISGWFRKNGESLKTGHVDLEKVKKEIEHNKIRSIKINEESVKCFLQTIELFTKQGIKVILLNTPIIDLYNQHEVELHREVNSIFENIAHADSNIEYIDLNPEFETQYNLFRDPIHLNRDGQEIITEKMIGMIYDE